MIAVLYSIHSVFKRNHDEPWFGFGRTVPGMDFEACEHTETTRPERGRRFARVRRGSESGAGGSAESET